MEFGFSTEEEEMLLCAIKKGDNILEVLSSTILSKLEARCTHGDRSATLDALYLCLSEGIDVPSWVKTSFCESFRKISNFESDSWDDAFGRPHKKGAHLSSDRKKRRYSAIVVAKVIESGAAKDNDLFEKIGRELGIGGKTLTEGYYYDFINDSKGHPLLKILKKYSEKA